MMLNRVFLFIASMSTSNCAYVHMQPARTLDLEYSLNLIQWPLFFPTENEKITYSFPVRPVILATNSHCRYRFTKVMLHLIHRA